MLSLGYFLILHNELVWFEFGSSITYLFSRLHTIFFYVYVELCINFRKLSETGPILLNQLRSILDIVDLVTILPLPGNNILKEMNTIADEMPSKGIFFTGSLLTEDSFLKTSFEKSNYLLYNVNVFFHSSCVETNIL